VAELSDNLLVVSILGYLAAMLAYAAEYAFGAQGAVARVADRSVDRAPALVPAAVSASATTAPPAPTAPAEAPAPTAPTAPPAPTVPTDPSARRWAGWAGRAAVVLTALAGLTNAATLVTRALAAGRVPWGNLYEFLLALTVVATVAWLVVLRLRPGVRPLGLLLAFALIVLLGSAGTVYTDAGPLVPALNSAWLKIHVSAAALAGGVFLVGFGLTVLYLLRRRYEAGTTGFPAALAARAPAAATLERLAFRVHAFGFPIWTAAVIFGAIWAEAAWGRYWGWDPKETWAFITWVCYAAYLHARATPSVKRTTTAWLAIAGWAALLINVYGVNLFVSSLHSYSGVN
jgi:cytochrome c-type biogenesis protein CcsB